MDTDATDAGAAGEEEYVLATGPDAAMRLELLEQLYGPATEGLLAELVPTGSEMAVADIGCGVGTVVSWLGTRLGPRGSVTGVDISPEQLSVAAHRATRLGLTNVQFHCASVYDTGLPRRRYDLVCCRSLLSHLRDPQAAVLEMASLVTPGGTLLLEDIDMATIRTEPPSSAYSRVVELYFALAASNGCDYSVGSRLSELLRGADAGDVSTRHDQPALSVGEGKRWWEYTFIETAPAMISAGVASAAEVADLCAQIEPLGTDEVTTIFQPTHFQAWGRIP